MLWLSSWSAPKRQARELPESESPRQRNHYQKQVGTGAAGELPDFLLRAIMHSLCVFGIEEGGGTFGDMEGFCPVAGTAVARHGEG